MIKELDGDILKVDTQVIVQQVNCQGVMGSGLAKQIKNKYPVVYERYKEFCNKHSPDELLGRHFVVKVAEDKYVANIFGQLNYGRDKNVIYTDYKAFKSAIFDMFARLQVSSIKTIAVPKNIGCGLANGDWDVVYKIIQDAVSILDDGLIEVKIVNYNKEVGNVRRIWK